MADAPDNVKSASVAAGKPAPSITLESHLNIVAKLESYIKILEADVAKAYSKSPVIVCSVLAFVTGVILGLFL
jgi:hypothetical protein